MNVLITAAGGGGTNGILKTYSSEDINFIGVNSDYYKAAASVTAITYQIVSASNELEYIEQLNKIIAKHDIQFVIPNSDIEVEVVSKNKDRLNAEVFVQDVGEIIISNDKLKTYSHCVENGINVPKTIDFSNYKELEEKSIFFKSFPLWCRIKQGAGSKHTMPVSSIDEAVDFIKQTVKEYNLSISDFTVSDYLPGDDCLISSIWKDGELKFIGMAHRMSYAGNPGQSAPTLIKKMFREELLEFSKKVVFTLSGIPNGIYNIDVKYDSNGNIALTEFNLGRFYYNMSLFNSSKEKNFFEYYIESIVQKKEMPTIITTDELFFLRDQDNFPVVLSQAELESKVRTLDGD